MNKTKPFPTLLLIFGILALFMSALIITTVIKAINTFFERGELVNTIYTFFIVFWFAAAVFHSFDTRETGYSKTMIWLAFVSISSLIVGFQI